MSESFGVDVLKDIEDIERALDIPITRRRRRAHMEYKLRVRRLFGKTVKERHVKRKSYSFEKGDSDDIPQDDE